MRPCTSAKKNIDVQDSTNQGRLIAIVASIFKGQAASWFTFNQEQFTTLRKLADELQAEFIPPNIQELLRAELLFRLKQANCNGPEDYVSRFRTIVKDMSENDQITCFDGLVTRTREEVSYRR
ncbi:hypothetical protein PsorP6_013667 [Peronosclerospora sorghi]|uniref:Uncharacterized protein n=1 Tax=Peronosclerospora sorghi TaxID=230839 RepID=A0ACC0VGB3_9STRA|nr:hypothetical protein PsorP6_013667 [Peronosclerospora sorghi]